MPATLKKWQDTLAQAIEDMRDDFMLAVKKAIVDFVLRDPSFVESLEAEYDTPERRDLVEISKNWGASYRKSKARLEKTLHVVNPCLAQLLDLWFSRFR